MENYLDIDVNTKQDFIKFIALLHKDFLKNGNKWENNTLQHFLEALHRYSKDIEGYYDNTHQATNADNASWKVFADMLKGATIYE